MTAIERTAYPLFRYNLTPEEISQAYIPSDEELVFVRKYTRQPTQRIAFLLALKCVQQLGYFPKLSAVPMTIQNFICDSLHLPHLLFPLDEIKRTRHRHHQTIRQFIGLKSYTDYGQEIVKTAVVNAVMTMSDPADLINVAVEQLYTNHIELPAYSTLDRQIGHLRTRAHQQIYEKTLSQLSSEQQLQLDILLIVPDQERFSPFNRLKESPGAPTLTNLRLWEKQLVWLNTLLDVKPFLKEIAHTKIKQFAREAYQLELGDMHDIKNAGKRYLLLLCLLHEARTTTYDQLVAMFLRRLRRIHHNAKEKLKQLREEYLAISAQLATALNKIAEHAQDTEDDSVLGSRVRQVLDEYGGASQLAKHAKLISAYHSNNHLPLLWNSYRSHRAVLFRLMKLLPIQSATQDTQVIDALTFIQPFQNAHRKYLPSDIDLEFADPRWLQLVKAKSRKQPVLRRKQLEICIFHYLAVGLSRGDLYVTGSDEYADYRKQLLPWDICEPQVADYCQTLGLPATATEFVQQLQKLLQTTANRVDAAFPDNSDLTIDADGRPHLKRTPAQTPPEGLEDFRTTLKTRLPKRHLLDVLKYAHHRIGYTRHFGPPSGSDSKMNDAVRKYLVSIFGYGCGLGAAQTASHTRGIVTRRSMKRINDQHISSETLENATRDVINEYARFQLPFLWGSGKHAVADGTHIKLLENNLLGQHHFRYGEYGAIAYHHVSDTYVAIFSHFISCGVWEAVYILDGLLKNKSAIQPDTVHADTQGQTETVFGLAHLLGIQLMPRMRNWNKVDLCRPDKTTSYKHIESIFNSIVNWKLIEKHWQDLMQVILSIQAGKVLPSMLLQKLGTHNRRNKLYRAFAELGRVIRTLFLLNYLSDVQLRQSVHSATTLVERYNGFLAWLSFGGDGVLRVKDPVEQEKRLKYLSLVGNTVMLQNVVDITSVINKMVTDGYPVTKELVSRISPYMTGHIKRFGEYILEMDDLPEPLPPHNDILKALN